LNERQTVADLAVESGMLSLDRAILLLRALSSAGETGLRLVDLQVRTELPKATVHRLLSALSRHGFVVRGTEDKRYRIGQELAFLALSTLDREADLYVVGMRSAAALAHETGDTVCLLARSGIDSVCLGRQFGSYPIKALTINVGDRRLLGIGASSVAILASMGAEECDRLIDTNSQLASRLGTSYDRKRVRSDIEEARRQGFAFSDGVFHVGVRTVAVAIRDFRGEPIAALVVAAIAERIPKARIHALAQALIRERKNIEKTLNPAGRTGQLRVA
jgi:DNA-binding IclR family transcriptional regulator